MASLRVDVGMEPRYFSASSSTSGASKSPTMEICGMCKSVCVCVFRGGGGGMVTCMYRDGPVYIRKRRPHTRKALTHLGGVSGHLRHDRLLHVLQRQVLNVFPRDGEEAQVVVPHRLADLLGPGA